MSEEILTKLMVLVERAVRPCEQALHEGDKYGRNSSPMSLRFSRRKSKSLAMKETLSSGQSNDSATRPSFQTRFNGVSHLRIVCKASGKPN